MNKRERLFHLLQCVLVSALVAGAVVIGLPGLHAAGSASFVDPSRNDFRLTSQTGVAVPIADQSNVTTVYCTPYRGDHISLYTSSVWNDYSSAEFSLALGTLADGTKPEDVFCFDSSGTPTLEFLVWASTTARATALVQQNGVWVKSGALTRRYMGTFFPSSTTQYQDTNQKRFLYNASNRVLRDQTQKDTTTSWTHAAIAWVAADAGATTWKNEFILGLDEDYVEGEMHCGVSPGASSSAAVGIGLDSTTVNSGIAADSNGSIRVNLVATYVGRPGIGYHYLQGLTQEVNATTATYVGAPSYNSIAEPTASMVVRTLR